MIRGELGYAVTAARRLVCAVLGSLICAVSTRRDRVDCRHDLAERCKKPNANACGSRIYAMARRRRDAFLPPSNEASGL